MPKPLRITICIYVCLAAITVNRVNSFALFSTPRKCTDGSELFSKISGAGRDIEYPSFESVRKRYENSLPIFDLLDGIMETFSERKNMLLEASPGAGKTTVVPLAVALSAPQTKNVIVVEPRRVAARSAAQRMASMLGEAGPGETVGYAIRGEAVISKTATLVQVVTDGVLLNRLREDPELTGVDVVIFDEFHERGVGSDTALALCRESQLQLRPDLSIVVMSATLLGEPQGDEATVHTTGAKLQLVLGGEPECRVLQSLGQRRYPVTIKWPRRGSPPLGALLTDLKLLIQTMSDVIEEALDIAPARGHVLAFLPGSREIRRVVQELERRNIRADVCPLYGALSKPEQDRAIDAPFPGKEQRVIVSSPIAEASLTIEGVTCVVDSGLRREPRYDVDTGMPRLVTVRCSRDSLVQRSGRAGRTQEGMCIRLFSEAEMNRFPEHSPPEIKSTDLTPTTLLLHIWGCSCPSELLKDIPFVDPPPKDALLKSYQLLSDLGALESVQGTERFRITKHGQAIAKIATHPRLASCIEKAGKDESRPSLLAGAVTAAAILDNEVGLQSSFQRGTIDLALHVREVLRGGTASPFGKRVLQYAGRLGEKAGIAVAGAMDHESTRGDVVDCLGEALLPGFVDLVAQYKGEASYKGSTYGLSLGRSARLDNIRDAGEFVVVADTSTGDDGKTRIRTFAKVDKEVLQQIATEHDEVFTVPSQGHEVRARRILRVGAVELSSTPLPSPPPDEVTRILLETIRSLGGVRKGLLESQSKDVKGEIEELTGRVRLASTLSNEQEWPNVFRIIGGHDIQSHSEEDEASLEAVFIPWLAGAGSLKKVDILQALLSTLSPDQLSSLDSAFPVNIIAPDGSAISLSYIEEIPSASAKLQQFFGSADSPQIGPRNNRIPISVSLLSPSDKLLARTVDLPFFWKETYPSIRAEMRGRYPKHPWPEDPMTASPTRLSKKQLTAESHKGEKQKANKKKRKK